MGGLHDIFSGYDTPDLPSELVKLEFDDDEGYNSTTEEFYDEDFEEIPVEDEPNFITLTKLQPVLPPVILMGGKVREDSEDDFNEIDEIEDINENIDEDVYSENDLGTFVESLNPDIDAFGTFNDESHNLDMDDDVEDDQDNDDYFKTFKSYLKDKLDKKLGLDVMKVGQVIDEFKKNAKELIPDKVQIQQIKQSAEDLGSVLKEKWDQLDIKEEKKKVDKLAKTIIKALNKAKDAISEEFATDQDLWSKRLQRIQLGFQSKWQEVMTKFLKKENDKTCD